MTDRRGQGDGGIDQRGEDRWRLRYWANGARHTKTFRGSKADAKRELRRILKSADDGAHVAPNKLKLTAWIEKWLALLQRPDGNRRLIGRRSWERYEQLCRVHIVPALGSRAIQQIAASEIDALYVSLEKTLAPRTVRYVHATMTTCLNAAIRKGILVSNPAARADAPAPDKKEVGQVLDQEQLTRLLAGFRALPLYPIVAVGAFTGARRGEILALRWSDFDPARKTLSISRAVEQARKSRRVKEPKTARGFRTITIDDGLVEMLSKLRESYVCIIAGVGVEDAVDLSLFKLPDGALIFPSPNAPFDLTRLRSVNAVTHQFAQHANRLGFSKLRFHDLRGTHETMLLDAGVPVHVVAARCGHDPAVLLHIYAKRTKKADTSAAAIIGAMSKAMLGN